MKLSNLKFDIKKYLHRNRNLILKTNIHLVKSFEYSIMISPLRCNIKEPLTPHAITSANKNGGT